MWLTRPFLVADIVPGTATDVTRMSKRKDFVTGPFRAAGKPRGNTAIPCLIDIPRGRTLYVPDLDKQQLRQAAFANVHARMEAVSLLSVPWEAGPINRPFLAADPIYVFSSGRCGSTLLHKILMAAEIQGISEPDIATALISSAYTKYRALRPVLRWATRSYARDLVSALSDGPAPFVVKLRSQFCRAAKPLLRDSRERRTIFMTRDFEDWSRSVVQQFPVRPGFLLQEYRNALQCYAWLRQATDCHFLRYEDLVANPRRAMARLSQFLGHEIAGHAVDQAMAVHSQEGTRLAEASQQGVARWEGMRDEVMRLWTASGTAELCARVMHSSK